MGFYCVCQERLHLNMYTLLSVSVPKPCLDYMYAFEHRWARLLKQQSSIIVVYRLPTKENKLPFLFYVSVLCFCLKQTSGSFPFPFFVCSKWTEVAIFSFFLFLFEEFLKHGDKETKRHGDGGMEHGDIDTRHGNMEKWSHRDMDMETWTWILKNQTEYGKRKPRLFSLIHLPFAHRANGSLSFVCLLTKNQTEVIPLQTD